MWAWKDEPDPNLLLIVAVLLILIFTLGLVDLSLDLGLRNPAHLVLEVVFLLLCMLSALFLGHGWLRARNKLGRIRAVMAEREEERDKFRDQSRKLLAGRAELAAFFLEDLLLPMETAPREG